MSKIPKHEARRKGPKKPPQTATTPAITLEADMSGIEVEIGNLARSVRSYGQNAYEGHNAIALFTDPSEGAYPVRLQLEGEAVERIATAFERIAAALEAVGAKVA